MSARAARNALVVEHLPLVGFLVNDMARRAPHLSRDDLASAGSLGLLMAADRFDPSQGVPFGAFARQRILGSIADELRSADWATRTQRKKIKESLHVQEALSRTLGRTPTVDEIAQTLGVERAQAAEALADARHAEDSLDESEADEVVSALATPEDVLIERERAAYLRAAIEALPERPRYIVEQMFFHDRTVGEIAVELGITHSAVSQQRSLAMELMRDGLHTHGVHGDGQAPVPAKVAQARRAEYLGRLAGTASAAMSGARLPQAAQAAS